MVESLIQKISDLIIQKLSQLELEFPNKPPTLLYQCPTQISKTTNTLSKKECKEF